MKKNLFILAAAAVALASCSSDDLISENAAAKGGQPVEIALNPVSQVATRAAGTAEYNAVEGVDYPQNYDMKVVSYIVPETGGTAGNYFGSATAEGAPLFSFKYAGHVQNANPNNYWGGKTEDDVQYWPLSPATLNFLAVTNNGSPDADVVSETFQSNYASGVTVTLSDNKPAAAHSTATTGQHDLMYGLGRAQVTKSGNALTIPEKVDMQFKHALAWVYFRVKAGNDASTAISIKSIKLNGAKYAGTFSAAVDNYDKAEGSGVLQWNTTGTKWTAASAEANNVGSPNVTYNKDADGDTNNDSKSLTTDFVGFGDGILVVPTSDLTTTPSMSTFTIEYYLNGVLQAPFEYTPQVLTFDMGKKYIFDITMSLSEIFINPSVVDWDEIGNVGEFVDIPTYTIGQNIDYGTISKAKATYKFNIVGCTGTPTIAVDGGSTAFESNPTYSAGVVTFTVDANASAERTYTFTITDTGGTAKASTITFKQAGN